MARRISVEPELTLDGKNSPKLRRTRRGDITPEQIETFLATLAETCNVVRSARKAGVSANWMYRKRRIDAGFRLAWAAAVREGYARLELVLLERAMKGTPKLVRTARGTDRVMREYSTALAVALLKRHAELAEEAAVEPDTDQMREVRERILDKLQRLKEREEAIETKAAPDRLELIRWALRTSPSCSPARAGA
ncbi:MAG TPA: hypothetical protein VFO12_01810 [Sphingomicrobium sp.]|nr:hypothetical protein [Sphingomicrobium sp.]